MMHSAQIGQASFFLVANSIMVKSDAIDDWAGVVLSPHAATLKSASQHRARVLHIAKRTNRDM